MTNDMRRLAAELAKLAENRTPGDWKDLGDGVLCGIAEEKSLLCSADSDGMEVFVNPHDCAFVAALVNAWPKLYDALMIAGGPD